MPVGVRPRRAGESGKPFKIVLLVGGKPAGAVEGESATARDAHVAAGIRNRESKKSLDVAVISTENLQRSIRHGRIYLDSLAKLAARTTRDRSHDHALNLPDVPEAGTFVTKPARTPGAGRTHVHVLVVRPGARAGQIIVSSPGVDGHVHRIRLGDARTSGALRRSAEGKALDAAPGGAAAPLQRESVEGRGKRRKRKKGPKAAAYG